MPPREKHRLRLGANTAHFLVRWGACWQALPHAAEADVDGGALEECGSRGEAGGGLGNAAD